MAALTDREPRRSPIRRLRAVPTLATTFRIFARSPIFFLTFCTIQLVPAEPLFRLLGWPVQGSWYVTLGPVALDQILLDLMQAAMLDRALRLLERREASLRETIGPGVRRALPVLLVSLVQVLAATLGFVLLVVPGFFVSAALAVAGPICLAGQSPGRSIAQSWRMTRGARGAIAAALLVLWLPYLALGAGFLIFTGFGRNVAPYDVYTIAPVTVAMSAWTTILGAVAYHALRPDTERAQIAGVFA